MISILGTSIVISLVCMGWYTITREGMILGFIETFYSKVENKVLDFILKPIIGCVICFASFWGVIVFYSLNPITLKNIPYLAMCCLISAFFNHLLTKLYHA